MNEFQSTLHPAAQAAGDILDLTWYLVIMGSVVFLMTMLLLLKALSRKTTVGSPPGDRFILWAGLFLPVVVLLGTLVYSLEATLNVRRQNQEEDVFLVEFVGHQYWWEVRYPQLSLIDANEIYVPVGRPVRLVLSSKDVIHSFWVPNVHGKMDMLPETKTQLSFTVTKPGRYRGQCAEFCGAQHALMAYDLVALPEEEFAAWVESRKPSLPRPQEEQVQRGKEVFEEQSCHTCHAVRDTEFKGRAGPDLTHLSTRLSLGAGTIPNSRQNLARWVRHSQKIKPFNRMPGYPELSDEELKFLTDYLMTLK